MISLSLPTPFTTSDAGRKKVTIVCPFYNEGLGVAAFYDAMIAEMGMLTDYDFEVVCVDDGSKDCTLVSLIALSERDSRFRVVELTRNFGKEAALTAGLDSSRGDLVIPIDADLQDPPSLIGRLIRAWEETGADVVLAKRGDRDSDSFAKRLSAAAFYDIHNWVSHIKIPANVGDCRLMTRPVVEALKLLPEKQRFMKGLFAWVGFKSVTIEYMREQRFAGSSKFSGWRLWNFALEGITSFSSWPLRVWTYIGLVGALTSLSYGVFIVLRTLLGGVDVPGYASLLVLILFFGSLQLIGLGVLGEYIGRIYMESKHRPAYLVRQVYRHHSTLDANDLP
jgi:glycosyltransferase involved in cell wall biosynthesis